MIQNKFKVGDYVYYNGELLFVDQVVITYKYDTTDVLEYTLKDTQENEIQVYHEDELETEKEFYTRLYEQQLEVMDLYTDTDTILDLLGIIEYGHEDLDIEEDEIIFDIDPAIVINNNYYLLLTDSNVEEIKKLARNSVMDDLLFDTRNSDYADYIDAEAYADDQITNLSEAIDHFVNEFCGVDYLGETNTGYGVYKLY